MAVPVVPLSYPLRYLTLSDPKPRPFRPKVFGDLFYSQSRTRTTPSVMEVSDTSDSKAMDASGTKRYEASCKSLIPIVGLSREREKRNVTALDAS